MAARSLSLPMFPELARDQVRRVATIARTAAEWDGHKKLRRKSTYSRAALRVPAGSDNGSKRLTVQTSDSMAVAAKRRGNTNRGGPLRGQHVSKA
jgi:hypothetical protein